MARRKIETRKGAIAPGRRELWEASQEKLCEAEQAINAMKSSRDRVTFERSWADFVDAIEQAWAKFFHEGKRAFSDFQPWAGPRDKERKKDDLLRYLIESRHQSQHGNFSLAWETGSMEVAPGFSGYIKELKIYPNGTYDIEAEPLSDSGPEATVVHDPGKPLLSTIYNRKTKQYFHPPTNHLGKGIGDVRPVNAAKLGLKYYKNLFGEAFEKFTQN